MAGNRIVLWTWRTTYQTMKTIHKSGANNQNGYR